MKKHASTLILLVIFFIGLSLLLYPLISSSWNAVHQSLTIAVYSDQVGSLSQEDYQQIWQDAHAYNRELEERDRSYELTEAQKRAYRAQLDIGGTGIMGCIEIPAIKVSLPIYHGVDDAVLQIAAGHLDWTSLPVGGPGTHCVLSGHRGLPSSTLFTHLDRVQIGDVFYLRVLDEVLSYEVDQIRIVEPDDIRDLVSVPGEDLCTLVTCTPYGVNSHRLLVRGYRVESEYSAPVLVPADAMQIEPMLVAPVLGAPLLLAAFVLLLTHKKKH